jgi:hypothetical protein
MLTKRDWWIVAWVSLFQSLVVIVTLGFVNPEWQIEVLGYYMTLRMDEWAEKHPRDDKYTAYQNHETDTSET